MDTLVLPLTLDKGGWLAWSSPILHAPFLCCICLVSLLGMSTQIRQERERDRAWPGTGRQGSGAMYYQFHMKLMLREKKI